MGVEETWIGGREGIQDIVERLGDELTSVVGCEEQGEIRVIEGGYA